MNGETVTLEETVEKVISDYLDQLDDPGEVDAQDLADNVVIQLRSRGHLSAET